MKAFIKPAGYEFLYVDGWIEGMRVIPTCARGKEYYGKGPFTLVKDRHHNLGFITQNSYSRREEFFFGDSGEFTLCPSSTDMRDFL